MLPKANRLRLMNTQTVVIIGAGPAGLTAAWELLQRNQPVIVLEKSAWMGGIARTEIHDGYRFDIGGHRFFTRVPEVAAFWQEMLGEEFQRVPRLSRIYYKGHFFNYPLELKNTLRNIGLIESGLILLSYLRWRAFPSSEEVNFEQWVTNRFGARLYRRFFKTYTEKVWGIPCCQIGAEWAAQRIRGLSLKRALLDALFGRSEATSLIREFDYPRLGPGMMWDRCRERIEARGGCILTDAEVVCLRHDGVRVRSVQVRHGENLVEIEGDHFFSTMPLNELIAQLDPAPPAPVREAARSLSYRDFLLVGLIVDAPDLFPDNWLYIHSPDFRVGRIQNFKNWSPDMVPQANCSSLGMEYFCTQGDDLWSQPDDALIALARQELTQLGLAKTEQIRGGVVIRQPKAYPVYDEHYSAHLKTLRAYLAGLTNFQTIGRNGMHRYNNQDHSMLTAMLAVRNLFGEQHDLWSVNTERSYIEDVPTAPKNG